MAGSSRPSETERSDSFSDVDSKVEAYMRGLGLPRARPVFSHPELAPGARIAAHLLVLRRLGDGANGVVYLARDTRLRRDVAVKLVARRSRSHDIRLEREAEAMARLAHPNVLVVYEVGTRDDGIYIVTEYVDGGTLRRWLLRTRRRWPEIVEAFVQAAEGLQAAHSVGVSHLDFKPENVLVGSDGRLRIADFGLARSGRDEFFDDTTNEGGIGGTPAYMAPEQVLERANGPLADQFAFGVCLFEALCGERPYRALAAWDARAEDLRPPPGRLPAWLRTAMVRTVALDPRDRFADLAAVTRALRGGLVRSAQRRRAGAAAALVLATTVSAIAVAAWRSDASAACEGAAASVDHVWNPSRRAEIDHAFASTGSAIGAVTAVRIDRSLDRYRDEWATARFAACEAARTDSDDSPVLADRRIACLERRKTELGALVDALVLADREAVRRSADAVEQLVPIAVCADAERLMAALPPPENAELHAEVESVRDEIAQLRARGALGDGRRHLDGAAVAVARARELGYGPLLAEALVILADARANAGRTEAPSTMEDAYFLALSEDHTAAQYDAATRLTSLISERPDGIDDAELWFRTADAVGTRLGATPDMRARLLVHRAQADHAAGDLGEAERRLHEALALARGDGGESMSEVRVLATLSGVLGAAQRFREAREFARLSLEMALRLRGGTDPWVGIAAERMSTAVAGLGDADGALALAELGLEIRIRAYGPDAAAVADGHARIIGVLQMAGDDRTALEHTARALEIVRRATPDDAISIANLLNDRAVSFEALGEFEQALTEARAALDIYERALGPMHFRAGGARVTVARNLARTGDPEGAVREFTTAIDALAGLGDGMALAARVTVAIAEQQADLGRFAAAHLSLERAEARLLAAVGEDDVWRAEWTGVRGHVLLRESRFDEAAESFALAIPLFERSIGLRFSDGIDVLREYGSSLTSAGRPHEARAPLERAASLAMELDRPDAMRARIDFEIARALWASPRERERARQIAAAARERVADATERERIDDWLRSHRA